MLFSIPHGSIKNRDVWDRKAWWGDYFTINRARQYGKTTTLRVLGRFLEKEYMDFLAQLRGLLFTGKEIVYVVGVRPVESALMFGFVKVLDSRVVIANRIFETLLYNYFLSVLPMQQEEIYDAALKEKTLFHALSEADHQWNRELLCGGRDEKPGTD